VSADVAIVGGGPAGLAAAVALRRAGAGSVVVLEREAQAGGIPRHAHHPGFGLRDLRRVLDGPAYARRWAELAERAGADVRVSTQATGWTPDGALEVTSPGGRATLAARAVVLATGCRERPSSARLVAGTRPEGVMTTGTLQRLVYLEGRRLEGRAVVVGAEHVSFSALQTLSHAGARAVAMTTEHVRHQSVPGAGLLAPQLLTRTALAAIHGTERVEAVDLRDADTGALATSACELVILTADWIPDHELAVLAGAALDPGTRGPVVDAGGRTTRPGVFAAGNVLRGAEPADVAALEGRHVAAAVAEHLAGAPWPERHAMLRCAEPLHWIAPGAITGPQQPARGRWLLRAREDLRDARVELAQDGRVVHRARLTRVMPGRSATLAPGWAGRVDPGGGDVLVHVVSARRRVSPAARVS
jgi:thioredoxin reductase